jgi:hypothetical protein
MNYIKIRTMAVYLVSLFLISCGGGGGGNNKETTSSSQSSSSISVSIPQITYTGMTSPAAINQQSTDVIAEAIQFGPSLLVLAQSISIEVPTNADVQVIKEQLYDGLVTLNGRISPNSGYLIIEYKNFTVDGITISGKQVQNYTRYYSELVMSSFYFDNLTLSDGIETNTFNGTITWSPQDNLHTKITINCLASDKTTGQSLFFNNLILDYKKSFNSTAWQYDRTLNMEGAFYLSDRGAFTVSTLQQLSPPLAPEDMEGLSSYNGGTLLLTGDNSSAVLYSISSSWFSLAIDSDNDSSYELSRRYQWDTADPASAGVKSDVYPISNAGKISFWEVNEPFTLNSLYSHFNDEYIEHEWQLTMKPKSSIATVAHESSAFQTFIPDVSGDYVFSVKVKSREKSSLSTFVLRVHDIEIDKTSPLYIPEMLVGNVEIEKSDTTIFFDFQSYVPSINPLPGSELKSLGYIREYNSFDNGAPPYGNWLAPAVLPDKPGIYTFSQGMLLNFSFKTIPFETKIGIRESTQRSGPYAKVTGDFNGDNEEDIFFLNEYFTDASYPPLDFGLLTTSDDDYKINYLQNMPNVTSYELSSWRVKLEVADIDANGFDDVIINKLDIENLTQSVHVILFEANDKTVVKSIDFTRSCLSNGDTADGDFKIIDTGNIAGDSGDDILIVDGCSKSINVVYLDSTKTLNTAPDIVDILQSNLYAFSGYSPTLRISNLTLEGYDELIVDFPYNFTIYRISNAGELTLATEIPKEPAFHIYKFWDVIEISPNKPSIFLSQAGKFYTFDINPDLTSSINEWDDRLLINRDAESVSIKDINGDGIDDLILSVNWDDYIYLIDSNNNLGLPLPIHVGSIGGSYIDINNDNKLDLVLASERNIQINQNSTLSGTKDFNIFNFLLNDVSEYSRPLEQ